MKKKIKGIVSVGLMILILMLTSSCMGNEVSPNRIFSSALDAELIISDIAFGEEYRVTLHLSSVEEDMVRKGEIIYLSPPALSGIHVLSDELGSRIKMDDIEVTMEENELFLPFTLFSTGEIMGNEIKEEEIVYRYTDGRSVYFGVKEERITKITYRDIECIVEWIEVRQEKDK